MAIALENIDRRAYELNITFSILMSVLKKYKIHDVIMPVQLVHDDYAVYDDDIIFTRDGKNPIFFWAGLGFWVLSKKPVKTPYFSGFFKCSPIFY